MAPKRRKETVSSFVRGEIPQPSPYRKFLTQENEARFQHIVGIRFHGERGFNIDKLQGHPEILQQLQNRGWLRLNELIKDSNATIALEFYANTYGRNDYTSYVRGKMIDYSADAINSLLGLQAPAQCGVATRRSGPVPSTDKWWEYLSFLGREGAWYSGGRGGLPQRIATAHLKPVPKVWASFFNHTLESASNTSELIVSRIHGVLAILEGDDIDVGRLISLSIKAAARGKQTVYGHASIINALCERESVPREAGDILTKCITAFTSKVIDRIQKGPVEEQRPAELQPAQPEPQQPQEPSQQYQCTPFELAIGEWCQDLSHHLYTRAPRFPDYIQRGIREASRQPSHLDVYDRFGTLENLEQYIQQQRMRATEREEYLRSEFRRQEQQYLDEVAQEISVW
ncbi:hypothetical protein P8452_61315 [Trifolium repens]|nr:hypothetical protein P8452_61315 [Trifolium repens]